MENNRFYSWDADAQHISELSPEMQAIVIQNSKVWEEWELVRRSVYEIISRTGFRANFAETADFISSISDKIKPDIKEELWMVNIQIMCWWLTRDEHLPKMVRMLSNQQIRVKNDEQAQA
ncbi:MAG: hypothetical protein ACD_3C00014G0011 [uncultured bacterium (gcode 4)]|uniref:Uncharacterized protein n=1 Tax=uncultured bacterium (gcode 4) TaxID=1234023 RepID=K2FCJ2_9BACT|nr:MAG: hypothetical protein ACD_3C00014G0011 [uncultured bacterium (gcode 4)]